MQSQAAAIGARRSFVGSPDPRVRALHRFFTKIITPLGVTVVGFVSVTIYKFYTFMEVTKDLRPENDGIPLEHKIAEAKRVHDEAVAEVHASRSGSKRHAELLPCYMDFSADGKPLGRVVFELFWDTSPLTAENFRQLCTGEKAGLSFKNTHMHRIVPGFMCQGGDVTRGDGTGPWCARVYATVLT